MDPATDLGNQLVGTMMRGLCYQPPNLTQEENFTQAIMVILISVEIEPLIEGFTRITTMIDTLIRKEDHHTSQTETNLGDRNVTITIHDRLQPQDKILFSRIPADNPDQTQLT